MAFQPSSGVDEECVPVRPASEQRDLMKAFHQGDVAFRMLDSIEEQEKAVWREVGSSDDEQVGQIRNLAKYVE